MNRETTQRPLDSGLDATLAERLARLSPEKRMVFEQLVAEGQDRDRPAIRPRKPSSGPVPLSFAQQRLWFVDQLVPGSATYNVPTAIRLTTPIDATALERSLNDVVRRHEALRTTFTAVDGQPSQVITDEVWVPLPVVDLGGLPWSEREAEASRLATVEAQLPFVLAEGPLLRARLLRLDDADYVLLLTLHHIVTDGWSMRLLVGELSALYPAFLQGRPSPLPPLPIQYPDFAAWQRSQLQGETLDALLAYWRGQLDDLPVLQLPTDHPRPPVQNFRGATHHLSLPNPIITALRTLAQQEGATLFMTLLAAFAALLHRYTHQDDIAVGAPIAGRTRAETEQLIGFFVNTLVLRIDTSNNPSFRQLLQRTRHTALTAYAHQDLPFETLVEHLQPQRDLSRNPLFQVMLQLQPSANADRSVPVPSRPLLQIDRGASIFDLAFNFWEDTGDLPGSIEYSAELFDPQTIERLAGHFTTLLEGAAANPDQPLAELPLLDDLEQTTLIQHWNQTTTPYPDTSCIHHLIEKQAAHHPSSPAVTFQHHHLTYSQLNQRANQLAHTLLRLGAGPETLVGICLPRSLHLPIALLATLKAGAAYLPLDPTYPNDRLTFMLDDANANIVLTVEALSSKLSAARSELLYLDAADEAFADETNANPAVDMSSRNLAYVIYTSGSTGVPKGVLIEHRGLCNVATEQRRTFGVGPGSRVLQFASIGFDASVFELVMALCSGATLCLAPEEDMIPGPVFADLLRRQEITIVTLPPSALAALEDGDFPALEAVTVAGEACSPALVARWAPGRRFFNLYGPTEATIWTTFAECADSSETPPIGRPIANTRVYVLDAHLQPVPIGVPGELCIAGDGLARGYLNRPELTAERFLPDPYSHSPDAKLYKTGDLARYRPDGTLEFLGRRDDQVKLRGYRIELGEIAATLERHPAVTAATVTATPHPHTPGDKRLTAYVEPRARATVTPSELQRSLAEVLPAYMVPSAYVLVDSLPRTPAGKIDRHALPAADPADRELAGEYVAPRTPLEVALANLWSEILHVELIGIHDDFFTHLGGHSLRATQVLSRLRTSFEVDVPLQRFFDTPTIAGLAEAIVQQQAAQSDGELLASVLGELEGLTEEEVQRLLEADETTAWEDADG